MKESTSFKDAVKRVLVSEDKKPKKLPKAKKRCRSNYVAEAMYKGAPGHVTPAAASSSQSGGSKGMPPFAKASADGTTASVDMRDIGKQEDNKAKSHGAMPYPLDTVLDFIAHSGEDLVNALSMIDMSLRKNNVSLTSDQKELLKAAQQTLSSSKGNLSKAAKAINSIKL